MEADITPMPPERPRHHRRPPAPAPRPGRMISRHIVFQDLGDANAVRPTRLGLTMPGDNSAMTVWDEAGNEIFGDADFEITGGAERHFLNLLSDQSNIIS